MKKSLSSKSEPQQRLVITFTRGEEQKFISHLDMMRLWHRALRRAGMPVAYSQGFNPQPRISIASPLAVGVTSEGELMDVFLERKISPDFFARAVSEQLPQGVGLLGVKDIWPRLPSLQSQLRFAEYRIEPEEEMDADEAKGAIRCLMEKESLRWEHYRGERVHKYDLRELIDALWLVGEGESGYVIGMRLGNSPSGSGRPDQVLRALGFTRPARSIHRTKLVAGIN
ncbi:MAG: TIGR03936 family radical SAM-associated protein [Dehalococcoidia bacterium]